MMENDEFLATVIIGILFFIFVIIGYNIHNAFKDQDKVIDRQRIACEEKGGVYLDRTYWMGKSTGHNYTCVRKDTIIEVE